MPLHDWTRVDAGTFHAFHTAWITHLSEALNSGVLPSGYYAMPEQHLNRSIADVLALHAAPQNDARDQMTRNEGALAVALAPPKVQRRLTASAGTAARRRTLTIRHVSGHRIVALLEIVSPANKDRPSHVETLAAKIASAVDAGIHVLLVDVLPPGPSDPGGIHGAVWRILDPEIQMDDPPKAKPLTLAAYVAGAETEAYLEPVAVNDTLPDMPLFISSERYVNVPLEATYAAAFRGMPSIWREALN